MKHHIDMMDAGPDVNNEMNDAQKDRIINNNNSIEDMNDIEMANDDGYREHEEDDFDVNDVERAHSFDKRKAVSFIINLKEMHRIRETAAEDVASRVNNIVDSYINILKRRLYNYMQGLDNEIPEHTFNDLFHIELPFNGVVTAHERKKYIKENFLYVEPETVHVGQRLRVLRQRGHANLDVVRDTFIYIPLTESIEQLLQNKDILELVINQPTERNDRFYSDIQTGSVYCQNVHFQQNQIALPIVLYFDDVDICNPMSKRAGTHKIGLFYYSLGNLPVSYRSRLPAIRLLAVIKRNIMNKHNINVVLERIKKDLETLSTGITLNIHGNEYNIVGWCLCFVGDTLAAHEFGGFKTGVGFAFQKCRSCECTFNDMQENFEEHLFIERNLDRYDDQCYELSMAQTLSVRDVISRSYGINFRSLARDFPNFDLTQQIPYDIMHVIFEGVAVYEIKLVLKVLLDERFIVITEMNNLIENFSYGYANRSSQPTSIPAKVINGNETTLKQSASSMIVLMRLLPFFLIDKLNCPFNNQYIKFLIELCEITLILLSPIISYESVQMLRFMISSHLRQFKELFPDKNIIPKQHYLIHLPSTIEKFGALCNVWTMRFESKHNFVKERMAGCHNFKNIEKSISERFAMYECSLNLCDKHPLFNNDCMFGKTKPIHQIEYCKEKLESFFWY
ncbi:uncharacterized protein LOC134242286 [Saccostrea cucullata]|uniref:uncharacterized protein LOC134242286 n=1 Tax=Saccostrea cuccullata TaxID=36930 RepID=UPI002ED172B9